MEFRSHKRPIKIIKEREFSGTQFRGIYSGVNQKWYSNSWKEFIELKNIDQRYHSSNYYDTKLKTLEHYWALGKIRVKLIQKMVSMVF